jgi:hypothetical protein
MLKAKKKARFTAKTLRAQRVTEVKGLKIEEFRNSGIQGLTNND